MDDSLTIDFAEPFPLFPLPHCVLLPHATIPLHIFEPRYRRMIDDAMSTRRLIAMCLFEGEEWRTDYEGSPPLREYVCVGHVAKHDHLADGRSNILLQGACRARISHELPHRPYRKAILEPTESQQALEIDLSEPRERIEELLDDPVLKQLATVAAVHNWLNAEIPTAAMIDLLGMSVCDDPEQRYRLLAEPNVLRRARWIEDNLRHTRRTLAIAERLAPEERNDRTSVN